MSTAITDSSGRWVVPSQEIDLKTDTAGVGKEIILSTANTFLDRDIKIEAPTAKSSSSTVTTHSLTFSDSAPTSSDGSVGDIWLVGTGESVDGSNVTYEITTNYGTYGGDLENLKDSSTSTYWWSSENQSTGKYILMTFDAPVTLTSVKTYCSKSGDRLNTNDVLQVSADKSSWTQIGTFANQATNSFTGEWTDVKYLRIYASSTVSYWLYINYITLEYSGSNAWNYSFTSAYKKTTSGWEKQTSLDTLKSDAWIFA